MQFIIYMMKHLLVMMDIIILEQLVILLNLPIKIIILDGLIIKNIITL